MEKGPTKRRSRSRHVIQGGKQSSSGTQEMSNNMSIFCPSLPLQIHKICCSLIQGGQRGLRRVGGGETMNSSGERTTAHRLTMGFLPPSSSLGVFIIRLRTQYDKEKNIDVGHDQEIKFTPWSKHWLKGWKDFSCRKDE